MNSIKSLASDMATLSTHGLCKRYEGEYKQVPEPDPTLNEIILALDADEVETYLQSIIHDPDFDLGELLKLIAEYKDDEAGLLLCPKLRDKIEEGL